MERRSQKPSAGAPLLYRPGWPSGQSPQAHLHLKASLAWSPVVFSLSPGWSSPPCGEGRDKEDALSSDRLVEHQVQWRGGQSYPHTAFSPSQGTQPTSQAGDPLSTNPATSVLRQPSLRPRHSPSDFLLLCSHYCLHPPFPWEQWGCPYH